MMICKICKGWGGPKLCGPFCQKETNWEKGGTSQSVIFFEKKNIKREIGLCMSALISELINITAHKLHRPLLTIHIMKAYDANYSKIIKEHKYKDNDKDKHDDTDDDTDKIPEN